MARSIDTPHPLVCGDGPSPRPRSRQLPAFRGGDPLGGGIARDLRILGIQQKDVNVDVVVFLLRVRRPVVGRQGHAPL